MATQISPDAECALGLGSRAWKIAVLELEIVRHLHAAKRLVPEREKYLALAAKFAKELVTVIEAGQSVNTVSTDPVRTLTCFCCGAEVRGRQWWNRDKGFGICVHCAEKNVCKYGPEEVRTWVGERGIHWDIQTG